MTALYTWNAHAGGLLDMDQCTSPTTSFPSVASDYAQASRVQIQELEKSRTELDAKMQLHNADIVKLQGYMKRLFPSPWNEAMQAHMDSGFDCCAPSTVSKNIKLNSSRYLASEVVGVEPGPDLSAPAAPPIVLPVNPKANSCFGYSANYCSQEWGSAQTAAPAGAQCLQSSFAATNAWYFAACKSGGQINPQVCADTRIASLPGEYANCVKVIDTYRLVAQQKREVASNISSINTQIQGLKNPNRVNAAATSSETTSSDGGGLAMLGNILGAVAKIAIPIFNQYRSYQTQSGLVSGGPSLYRNNNNRMPAGAVPFYGPNYGYGFSHNGNYGGTPPMMQTGGFACSGGLLGSGLSLITQLFGNKGSFSALASVFGSNGGGLMGVLSNLLSGSNSNNTPPFRFGDFSPPYQVGGIYGSRQTFQRPAGSVDYENGNVISNFFAGNGSLTSRTNVPGYVRPTIPTGAILSDNGASTLPTGNAPVLLAPMGNSPRNTSGYLTNGYQSTPYFGNFGNILSVLFGGGNVNATGSLTF